PGVDLAAPGSRILGHPGSTSSVTSWDGTSMAAPYVSATAAMIWAKHPTWTPAQVKDAILSSVTPISGLDVRTSGLLNMEAALRQ
ncbi:MAG: S8 family serine peptidase, partial [Bacteroidota bacterium]